MRKPKIHPTYGIRLVGINFRERWNIVQFATESEIKAYIDNVKHVEALKKRHYHKESHQRDWWSYKQSTINESTQNNYLRKLWRKRHSESFKKDVLYRIDRNIARWNQKLGPTTGDGLAISYHFDRTRERRLCKNDMVLLTKIDEMGNLYFAKIDEINAPHPYVFNRENAQLGWIREMET